MLVYRGEYGMTASEQPFHTRLPVIYFGELEVAKHYAFHPNQRGDVVINPRVIAADITILQPFINTPYDPYLEIKTVVERLGIHEALRIAMKFQSWIQQTDYWIEDISPKGVTVEQLYSKQTNKFMELYFQAYPFFCDAEEINRLKALGYDGAIHGGSGVASAGRIEYCVFDAAQAVVLGV